MEENKEIEMPIVGNLRSQNYDLAKKINAPDSVVGAIIGDIVGSIYEFNNIHTKEFRFFNPKGYFTDDTLMTLAVYESIMDYVSKESVPVSSFIEYVKNNMFKYYDRYKHLDFRLSYGQRFEAWLTKGAREPYYSFGNGAAMRVGGVSLARSRDEAKFLGVISASVSHNHPEGLKGAECVSDLIYMAKSGFSKDWMYERAGSYYNLDSIDYIGLFDETCEGTIPIALKCFFESDSFEDAIRNAISVGGDSDTIASITGSIAGAYYGIPDSIKSSMIPYLDTYMLNVLQK